MKWFIFVIIAASILAVFALVYGITYLVNQKKRPKYKTTAPDDDPKFLRDLATRLNSEPKPEDKKPNTDTPKPAENNSDQDPEATDDKPASDK
jgi:hypothetical protein